MPASRPSTTPWSPTTTTPPESTNCYPYPRHNAIGSTKQMIDMKGKVAVILGVANNRSIAYSIAEKLALAGATIVLCYQSDRLKKAAEDLIEELGQTGKA